MDRWEFETFTSVKFSFLLFWGKMGGGGSQKEDWEGLESGELGNFVESGSESSEQESRIGVIGVR